MIEINFATLYYGITIISLSVPIGKKLHEIQSHLIVEYILDIEMEINNVRISVILRFRMQTTMIMRG